MAKKNWTYVCNLLRSEKKKVYRLPVVKNVKSNSSFLSALQTSFGGIRVWICDPRSHRSRCMKERNSRRALREFQKVRYFKTRVGTWVIELFTEWLV